jgi:hypothetical protein
MCSPISEEVKLLEAFSNMNLQATRYYQKRVLKLPPTYWSSFETRSTRERSMSMQQPPVKTNPQATTIFSLLTADNNK